MKNSKPEDFKLGVYQATIGDFKGGAIFLMDVSTPDESEFCFMTIFNPESEEAHELTERDWNEICEADGLVWKEEISEEIKDKFLFKKSFAAISGL
jgi:CRISPR/Cas system CSM-associated protein Csm4 (group 5 of RAMP superfamily)